MNMFDVIGELMKLDQTTNVQMEVNVSVLNVPELNEEGMKLLKKAYNIKFVCLKPYSESEECLMN